ncbi:ABC transporter transmembrane region 2-domain-containing protein [Syncephalis fuscata]|nr:ABC transporter transmembrane region 2-domain-containing protein [Syncephalis fuscata]
MILEKQQLLPAKPIASATKLEEQALQQPHGFNLLFLQRLFRIIRITFNPNDHSYAFYWYLFLLVIAGANEVAVYYVGNVPSQFFGVLLVKDTQQFNKVLGKSIGFIIAATIGKSLVNLIAGIFEYCLRNALTHHLHERFLRPNIFYPIVSNSDIDNTDQRIAQDVDKFASTSRQVFQAIVVSPFIIIYYTVKTWEVSGYWARRFVMSPVTKAVFMKERHEGLFRFLHVRLRTENESIAMLKGEKKEQEIANSALDALIQRQEKVVFWELPLTLVNNFSSYFGSIVSYLIIAIPIYNGKYDDLSPEELTALISRHSFMSMYLIFQFTTIVEQAVKFAELAGFTNRIGQMLEAIDMQDENNHDVDIQDIHIDDNQLISSGEKNEKDNLPNQKDGGILFNNVAIRSPTGQLLVDNLNLKVALGENWLVTGPNGSGKTSVLRVLCGLWTAASGECSFYGQLHRGQIQLLPQSPYLAIGSLRNQIAYPEDASTVSDEALNEALTAAGIDYLLIKIDSPDTDYGTEWSRILSPGEAQRLAFARLLYRRPDFAVLDEATSAIDEKAEGILYGRAIKLGITLVSIGHRASLRQFHQRELHLNGANSEDSVSQNGYTITNV